MNLVLPIINLSILDADILIIMQQLIFGWSSTGIILRHFYSLSFSVGICIPWMLEFFGTNTNDDVLTEHGGLLHVLPLEGTILRHSYSLGFVVGALFHA